MLFQYPREANRAIYRDTVKQNGKQHVNIRILRPDGQQRRQHACTDKKRENDRYKSGIAGNIGSLAKKVDIQYHLKAEHKQYQRAGYRK